MMGDAKDSSSPLPPLRIHHFLAWMAVAAAVVAVQASMLPPNIDELLGSTIGITLWTAFATTQWIAFATSLTILHFGVHWYRHGLPFPSQPGHWLAAYASWIGFYQLLNDLFLVYESPVAFILLDVPCHLVALIVCLAAYRRESTRYWRWGWLAVAVHNTLMLLAAVSGLLVLLYRLLYSLVWVPGPVSWQPVFNLGAWATWFLTSYGVIFWCILIVLISVATVDDLIKHCNRHWSHWAVVGTLLGQLVTSAIYGQWTIVQYL